MPLALGLTCFSLFWRSHDIVANRGVTGVLFAAVTLSLVTGLWIARRRAIFGAKATIALLIAALLIFFTKELHFQWMRYAVLNADPVTLARLGRHFVVGFRSDGFAEEIIARKGAAGLFITAHNVHGLDAAAIHAMLVRYQSLSLANGGKTLLIATDQEGGLVSRLSPPLVLQPALGELVSQHSGDGTLESRVRDYATKQGKALAALGVNLNFAPVVDVNHHIVNQEDRYTRIYQRAISADPLIVERVARWYCDALYKNGIRCTLKHFPGLGQVQNDTHLDAARLTIATPALDKSDWIPFKGLMQAGYPALTMLSHVHLDDVDPVQPVSTSKQVVDNLLRNQWHYDGLLITDDFSMAAILKHPGGIGAAAIDSLNAGVDLILISFDPDLYYPAMYALLEAEHEGRIDRVMLERSGKRLDALIKP